MNDPTPDSHTDGLSLGSQERLARDASPSVPARIGRFEVRRALGEGAFGCVYLAFDPNLNREVALKVPVGVTAASREEFLREARATAGITHPNVCQVFDADTAGNVPFIVSRYVGGGTLADMLKRANGALRPDEAAKIVRKLALGLAAAHAKGIVHRDLKPGNVLFDNENNEILITDFGLAKMLVHASQSSAGVKGTPAYMSPEQFGDGETSGDVGPLSDVYSLGVVFYELLTGQLPFTGNPFALMLAHIQTPPKPPSARRPGLDARFDALCLKALAKNPADRYASAKDFAKALADHLRAGSLPASNPIPAPIPAPAPAPARPAARPPAAAETLPASPLTTTANANVRAQAEADNVRGQNCYHGEGVPQDFVKASQWFEKAALQGYAPAQCNLGVMYQDGQGVPQDYAKARMWYEKSAAQGHAAAWHGLGYLYENGFGVPQDYAKARQWYETAAIQGQAAAQTCLGALYDKGLGIPQDYPKAHLWYEKAAAQGYAAAQTNLGVMYESGQGVPRDYTKARQWYEKAAAKGHPSAQAYLAELYENGRDVVKDMKRALELYRKAAAQGNDYAKKALTRLGEKA